MSFAQILQFSTDGYDWDSNEFADLFPEQATITLIEPSQMTLTGTNGDNTQNITLEGGEVLSFLLDLSLTSGLQLRVTNPGLGNVDVQAATDFEFEIESQDGSGLKYSVDTKYPYLEGSLLPTITAGMLDTDNGSDDDDSGDGSGGDSGDGSDSGGDNGDGSGGDGENGGEETTKFPPASGTEYVMLDQTNDLESKLSGVAILINTSTKATQSVDLTGTFANKTGALVLENGTYEFRADTSGAASDTYVDGAKTGTLTVLNADSIRTDGSAHMVDMFYVQDGVSYNALGIVGVSTAAADIPSTGTASFTGRVAGSAVTTAQGVDIVDGSSKIDVNFGTTGTVNVTLDSFTFQDQSTGVIGSGPFDKIVITGMTLQNAGFADGAILISKSGSTVNLTGTNTTAASVGEFFGYDLDTGHPEAAGGILLLQGDDGYLTTTYLGD